MDANEKRFYTTEREAEIESFCSALGLLPLADRLGLLEQAIRRLRFEERWQLLGPNQREHATGIRLSSQELEQLNACKTEKARSTRLREYSRIQYFRECFWLAYLSGESARPPVDFALGDPCMVPTATEIEWALEIEKHFRVNHEKTYLKVLNGLPMSRRVTEQEICDGCILTGVFVQVVFQSV